MMKNKKETFSANEINKFVYCPYQWYYERYYGQAQIRQLYNERNAQLGLKNSVDSNFKKGQEFHNSYLKKDKLFKTLKAVLFVSSLILGVISGIIYYFLFF